MLRGRLDCRVPGDQNHLAIRASLLDPTRELDPVHARQADVGEDDLVPAASQYFHGLLSIGNDVDPIPDIGYFATQELAGVKLVLPQAGHSGHGLVIRISLAATSDQLIRLPPE
jgi:hypothetical protein